MAWANYTFSAGSGNSGSYELVAEDDTGDRRTRNIVIDRDIPDNYPEIQFTSNNRVGDDSTVTVEFSDQHSGVKNYSVKDSGSADSVSENTGFDSCPAGDTCSVEYDVDTDGLSDGDQFTLEIGATDRAGNTNTVEKRFTYDTSYEGDTPSFEISAADDSRNIEMEGEIEDFTLTSYLDELDSGEPSDIRVKCFDEDGEFASTDYEDVDEDAFDFSCNVNGEDYAGSQEEFYVEACDEAGNCQPSDRKTYSFDLDAPFVTRFETERSYSVFNSDFEVSYSAGDDASGIQRMEYFFDESTSRGSGTKIEDESDNRFTVDTSSLSRGSHTVYFRAKDNVDRWSDVKSLEFDFYPNEQPEVSVDAPDTYNITAGASGSLQAVIRNSGELFVSGVNVSASGSVLSGDKTVANLASGDSVPVNFDVNTNQSHVGLHEVEISTDQPSASKTVEVTVRANSNQRQRVETLLSNYSGKLDELEGNISELRSSGLPEEMNDTLSSNVSEFKQIVKRSQQYVEDGKYFKALSELEGVSKDYERATSTFRHVKNSYEAQQRNNMIITSVVLLVLISIGAGVHFFRKGEFSIDVTEEDIPGLVKAEELFEEKFEGLKEFIEKEEQEVEKKFEGFN